MITQALFDVTVRISNISAISGPLKEIIDLIITSPYDTLIIKVVDIIVAHFNEIAVTCV